MAMSDINFDPSKILDRLYNLLGI